MAQDIIVGGRGFLGTAIQQQSRTLGRECVVVDRRRPAEPADCAHLVADLLTETITLPPGDVFLTAGNSLPRQRHPWTVVLDNVLTLARLMPQLRDRRVVLVSSVEVLGSGDPGHPGLPLPDHALREWCEKVRVTALSSCPPSRVATLCQELVLGNGRWTYGLAKRAQELLLESLPPASVTIFRLTNLFGVGQDRVIARLTRRALSGLPLDVTDTSRYFLHVDDAARVITTHRSAGVFVVPGTPVGLPDLAELICDEVGVHPPVRLHTAPTDDVDLAHLAALPSVSAARGRPVEHAIRQFVGELRTAPPPLGDDLPVVIPPRPSNPEVVGRRTQQALWSGQVKGGNHWSRVLERTLREALQAGDDRSVLLCASGSAALRLAIVATAGLASPGEVAILPSFTFIATAEILAQLGYRLRFVDVDPLTWTIDVEGVARALRLGHGGVVVAVDALGAPADYAGLAQVCRRAGVPLVADSAPAIGARYGDRPVGTQAVAHAFSMSFAKVVSAGGSGGALVLPTELVERLRRPIDWTRSSQLGELNAVIALEQVQRLDELVRHRHEIARTYDEFSLTRSSVVPQQVRPGDQHAYVHWVARFTEGNRAAVQSALAGYGIQTKPYYAPALHQHDWQGLAEESGSLPVTEALAEEALALPMSSEMNVDDAERVTTALGRALDAGPRPSAVCPGPRVAAVPRAPTPPAADLASQQ